ncbi:putative 1-acylglycerol-3-phosphate O-acyltransferase [Rosa chinensis]|uniref:1-acyl-sn-glycerol-3-phosphate acyltransferase n=1 Tax=Rosa chinensis TaxID=74649 RepID=A0A2P6RI54_ROSCH|nr:1-acyl-sn-glycerol-3-phosphate acyltransferase BAT2, chloroplastic isoform X1 [Rosa chinensis]PRQ46114.1 putative 1-acylglycerol-3-phosphate O-acyltransferase [Rosa chinensis]
MEVASHPAHSILCYKQSRLPSTSSLLPLFTHKGLTIGCSPRRRPILGKLSNSACHSVLCIPRKPVGISWCDVDAKEEFVRPYNDVRLHNQHKLSRHTVVHCGLVETGTPDEALPEVNMVSKVRGLCFYAITAFNAIYLFALMVVAHPFVLLLDRYRRRAQFFIAKVWATFAVTLFLNIKFEGLENLPPPDVPAVYVSNHQSFLDIYVLLTIGRPYKFISKTSIFLIPIIGWAMFLLGVIPLKRMDSKSQLECLKRCIYLLKKGSSVFFFPEGTRSKDGKLGDFKKGAFSLAAKTNVPVVPITLIGTGKIMPVGKEGILNTGPVKVVIHKPIEGTDTETLCRESRNIIAEALNCQG